MYNNNNNNIAIMFGMEYRN